jgi:hypothetical protein
MVQMKHFGSMDEKEVTLDGGDLQGFVEDILSGRDAG